MSGDVLVKWDWEITAAEAASSYGGGDASAMCIRDLAAALREERARVAELEAELRPFMTWACANCGRINPGTVPYCPCREESDE